MTTATAPRTATDIIASTRTALSAAVDAAWLAMGAAANAGNLDEVNLARQAFEGALAAKGAFLNALGLGD